MAKVRVGLGMASGRATGTVGPAAGVSFDRCPRRIDPAFAAAARQVQDGIVPFVILGVAGAEGIARLDAFPPLEGPRIGTNAVCLLASITKPIVATCVVRLARGR